MQHFGKQFTVDNYRCFREKQTARLAPVILLVGENNTGKTSFLALIRLMCKLVSDKQNPNFKEAPFDLGNFEDIVHHGNSESGQSSQFGAEFLVDSIVTNPTDSSSRRFSFAASFGEGAKDPIIIEKRLSDGTNSIRAIKIEKDPMAEYCVQINTANDEELKFRLSSGIIDRLGVSHFDSLLGLIGGVISEDTRWMRAARMLSSDMPLTRVLRDIVAIALMDQGWSRNRLEADTNHVFANAPVRSNPQRTYDPTIFPEDPERQYVPMDLARISSFPDKEWLRLKMRMEEFGQRSGLFDEIVINRLGIDRGNAFQIHLRKAGHDIEGPKRNLIDSGYGVSQVLPIIAELFRDNAAPISLLQHPEVHLHPRAQAALGTLFCGIAETGRQLIIETHSDYILDRIQIDLRKGRTSLKPEDVSILFFERQGLDVKIHSISLDDDANLRDQPQSYREFFMKETNDLLELSEN